jgi:tRNA nucleotidyltransferase (CCA-adding enzyme)
MIQTQKIKVSLEALFILFLLQKHDYEASIVGGAVRDTLLDSRSNETNETSSSLSASDYDFTTNALPEQIQEIFPEHFYENIFGTVGIAKEHLLEQMGHENTHDSNAKLHENESHSINIQDATKIHESLLNPTKFHDENHNVQKDIFEITTYRSDGTYSDHRRPSKVTWGNSLKEDLSRRDFTINAMAINVSQSFLENLNFKSEDSIITLNPEDYTIVDLHNGIQDISAQIIQTVGNPNKRFNEDALRMLRAVRFSVQLNMQIENDTFEAIIKNAQLLKHISSERISDEFIKMIKSDFPKEAIKILDEAGLLKYILPELLDGKGVMQGGHHTTDVWTHNLDALETCPSKDPIVRLATLLHDIAKPHTYKELKGKPTFYNHEVVGSRIAKNIAKRLKLSKNNTDRIFLLVRYHMFYYQPDHTDASIRRFMRKVGLENINDILDLREADRLGSGARKTSWRLEEMKQRMISQLHQPFSIKDLAINGHDLMENLKLEPGKKLGEILVSLFDLVLDNPDLNTKDNLLVEAKKFV